MFTEDLAPFFNTADFAESVTLTVGGSPSSVAAIFSAESVDPYGEFEGTRPVAWVRASDATGIVQGDTLTRGGTTYTVVNVRQDETGTIYELRLRA